MSTKSTRSFCQKLVWQKNSGGSYCKQDITSLSLLTGRTVGPKAIKRVMLKSNEHKIATAHKKLRCCKIQIFLAFKLSDVVFIKLIKVK